MGFTDVKPSLFVPFGGEGGEGGAAQMGDWGWPAKWGKRPAVQTGTGGGAGRPENKMGAFTACLGIDVLCEAQPVKLKC